MEKAFVCNRVSGADKISKLRENLRGDALKLIPEALTMDIDAAWKVLDKAYGKPVRLMKVRKKALLEMIFSKNNSLFDILGKFVPVMIGLKFDIRKAVNLTEGWKDPVFEELRSKLIGKAKGYQV